MVDDFSRECLTCVIDTSIGERVVRELERLVVERGLARVIVSDNGCELTSTAVLRLGRVAVGCSRIGRRDEETCSAQFHRDTRLSGKRSASRIQTARNLCTEHILVELRCCFRIGTPEMDVVVFEDGHD